MTTPKLEILHGNLIASAQMFADSVLLDPKSGAPLPWQDQWRALTAANGEFAAAMGGDAVTVQP